ncbi:hypothetical protein [Enterobacter phage 04_vB_Eclo_IJM]|nr:hypothetical protein [Enterobacter phage 04_vB_Eclo_IJM]
MQSKLRVNRRSLKDCLSIYLRHLWFNEQCGRGVCLWREPRDNVWFLTSGQVYKLRPKKRSESS